MICECGGIGIRASLRSMCPKGRVGSSPIIRTDNNRVAELHYLFEAFMPIRWNIGGIKLAVAGCSSNMRVWRNGRRATFRSWCPSGRVGSSPTMRTHIQQGKQTDCLPCFLCIQRIKSSNIKMRVWRNRYTQLFQKQSPSGLWVRVPPCALFLRHHEPVENK